MLPNKFNILGKTRSSASWNTRIPMIGPMGEPTNILYRPRKFSPKRIANLAAWYDLSNTSSYITATGVKLLGDLSGNSNVNVLALNGVLGNSVSAPVTFPLDGIEVIIRVAPSLWNPAINETLAAQWNDTNGKFIWQLNTTKTLSFYYSTDGTALTGLTSSVALPFASNLPGDTRWLRVRFVTNNGTQRQADFYYAADTGSNTPPVSWTQLGTSINSAGTSNLFNSTFPAQVGANNTNSANPLGAVVFYTAFKNQSGTTLAIMDPSIAGKLAATWVASTGETWTVNTSGDHGARICGARDQVEMTGSRQPTVANQTLSFSSLAAQHTQSAPFSFAQANTIFMVGALTTWASGTYMLDGDTANTAGLVCTTGTPKMSLNAGVNAAENSNLTVGQRSIFILQFNGASSSFQINKTTATTGNPGAGNPNGITIGALGSVVNFSDMTMNELVAYSGALDAPTISQVRAYLAAKWSVTL